MEGWVGGGGGELSGQGAREAARMGAARARGPTHAAGGRPGGAIGPHGSNNPTYAPGAAEGPGQAPQGARAADIHPRTRARRRCAPRGAPPVRPHAARPIPGQGFPSARAFGGQSAGPGRGDSGEHLRPQIAQMQPSFPPLRHPGALKPSFSPLRLGEQSPWTPAPPRQHRERNDGPPEGARPGGAPSLPWREREPARRTRRGPSRTRRAS